MISERLKTNLYFACFFLIILSSKYFIFKPFVLRRVKADFFWDLLLKIMINNFGLSGAPAGSQMFNFSRRTCGGNLGGLPGRPALTKYKCDRELGHTWEPAETPTAGISAKYFGVGEWWRARGRAKNLGIEISKKSVNSIWRKPLKQHRIWSSCTKKIFWVQNWKKITKKILFIVFSVIFSFKYILVTHRKYSALNWRVAVRMRV